jgi:hypothetical protein
MPVRTDMIVGGTRMRAFGFVRNCSNASASAGSGIAMNLLGGYMFASADAFYPTSEHGSGPLHLRPENFGECPELQWVVLIF